MYPYTQREGNNIIPVAMSFPNGDFYNNESCISLHILVSSVFKEFLWLLWYHVAVQFSLLLHIRPCNPSWASWQPWLHREDRPGVSKVKEKRWPGFCSQSPTALEDMFEEAKVKAKEVSSKCLFKQQQKKVAFMIKSPHSCQFLELPDFISLSVNLFYLDSLQICLRAVTYCNLSFFSVYLSFLLLSLLLLLLLLWAGHVGREALAVAVVAAIWLLFCLSKQLILPKNF